jgi:hypothetical protein
MKQSSQKVNFPSFRTTCLPAGRSEESQNSSSPENLGDPSLRLPAGRQARDDALFFRPLTSIFWPLTFARCLLPSDLLSF